MNMKMKNTQSCYAIWDWINKTRTRTNRSI